MGKKSRKAKGGGGLGRVDTAAGRALQGLVQSGQIKDGAHIKITDANRGHLAALLGDAKNVRVAGDVQSLRAAVEDPNVELHGGGLVGGRVAGPPAGVPPPERAPASFQATVPAEAPQRSSAFPDAESRAASLRMKEWAERVRREAGLRGEEEEVPRVVPRVKSAKKKGTVPLTTAEKAAVLHAIAQLDGKATQKKVRRAAESALGAPEGALDEKKAAVKEVCEDEMSKQASEAAPKKRKASGMSAAEALRAELKALKAENKKLKREKQ